ncbi:hypothetical protein T492DRAFT_850549 [Pavlovales sp. CCMP2436]|nr:hypothetical protein T492DRAFT_850549 [Pavlovales sp. CCMP2436]
MATDALSSDPGELIDARSNATEALDGLQLSVGVAPLVDVLRSLFARVDELHADVKARDEAAREALSRQQEALGKQQEQIDELLAKNANADAAARAAAEAVTPEEVAGALLIDVIGSAVEIGERSVAARERAELYATTVRLADDGMAMRAEAAAMGARQVELADQQTEATQRTEEQFGAVKTDLTALTEALEQVKAESGGGLDELKAAAASAAERLDAHDAGMADAAVKSAELAGALREELERAASDLGTRLERVEEVTGALGDVNAELEAKVLAEASRLVEAEAEARLVMEKAAEQAAVEATEAMEKLAGVLEAFKEETSADKEATATNITETAESLQSRFAEQLDAVQLAVQEQIVTEVLGELAEPKLKPRLEQMGLDVSGASANLARELVEALSAEHKHELALLQGQLASATELHTDELGTLAARLGSLADSIDSSTQIEELRGMLSSKAEAEAVSELVERLNALQTVTADLARAKARHPLEGMAAVIQIGRDGQPRLGTLQLGDASAAASTAPTGAFDSTPLDGAPAPSTGTFSSTPIVAALPGAVGRAVGAEEGEAGGEGGEQQAAGGEQAAAGEEAAAGEQEGAGDIPLRLLDADGNPIEWSQLSGNRNSNCDSGSDGGRGGGGDERELSLLRATIEEVRSAMNVKVDALALHRLRLQIAAHVENVQTNLLLKIEASEGRPAPSRSPPPAPTAAPAAPAVAPATLLASPGGQLDGAQARNLASALQGHAQMQEMIVEQLAAHENELENLKEMVGTFEGRGGLLARLHAQMAVLKRTMMDKADKDDVDKKVVDTKRLEREVRSKIERHVAELQGMLASTAGDAAATRRLLEERADLGKSYSEALFDGCIKAVAARVNTMQRTNHTQMVESLTSIDEDILRLERAMPAMGRFFAPGHAAIRQAGPRAAGRYKAAPKPYNPLSRGNNMYAWDMTRGGRPLPLVPMRQGANINQTMGGGGRRGSSREMGSPISAVLQAGHMRSATPLDAHVSRPGVLPKLAIVGERRAGSDTPAQGASRATVPRAQQGPAQEAYHSFQTQMARTKAVWGSSEGALPLTGSAMSMRGVVRR